MIVSYRPPYLIRLLFLLLLPAPFGCGKVVSDLSAELNRPRIDVLSALRYPQDAPYGEDLDIVVIRRGGQIELDNRTPRTWEQVQLWLNQEYVGTVEKIEIGTGNEHSLLDFINEYREPYPVGGLLTPDKDRPLLAAHLFVPATGMRHRLVVRLSKR